MAVSVYNLDKPVASSLTGKVSLNSENNTAVSVDNLDKPVAISLTLARYH